MGNEEDRRNDGDDWFSPGSQVHIPSSACEENGCEEFEQPSICCPVGMSCHKTEFTPSGVYCCPTISASSCNASASLPPLCDPSLSACEASTGGGCCPPGSRCDLKGCIRTYRAAPGFGTEKSGQDTTAASDPGTGTEARYSNSDSAITVTDTKAAEIPQATVRSQASKTRLEMVLVGYPQVEKFYFVYALPLAWRLIL
ncbi:hypothetical protein F5Y15DRAFT_411875 [Xylariaceae sp. FL0016]|nr:hypothetical protein F5Y15DRAFT_411875 [Xylariaceae sp. FL0016]